MSDDSSDWSGVFLEDSSHCSSSPPVTLDLLDDSPFSSPALFQHDWLLPTDPPRTTEECSAGGGRSSVEEHGEVQVKLLHKPRGSRGNWIKVEPNEKIRVAKEKGKKLKVVLHLGSLALQHLTTENIKVHLVDQQQRIYLPAPGIFLLDGFNWEGRCVEIEVKLFRMHKNLRFVVEVEQEGKVALQVQTPLFSSHNSGTGRKAEKVAVKMEDASDGEESLGMGDKKRRLQFEDEEPGDCKEVTTIPGSLTVHGQVKARLFTQYSDLRLKTNIEDIMDAVELVTNLQGKTYTWKTTEMEEQQGGRKVIGLIAQEVMNVVPEVVHEDPETGLLSVSYAELIPILIEAFKQFIKEYEETNACMKDQLGVFHERLEGLSTKLEAVDAKTSSPLLKKALEEIRSTIYTLLHQYAQYVAEFLQREGSGLRTATCDMASNLSGSVATRLKQIRGSLPNLPTLATVPVPSLQLPSFSITQRQHPLPPTAQAQPTA